MDVNGKNQQSVLTGQVCVNHRLKHHDAAGTDEMLWCPNCGKNDKGEQKALGNGGWGS